MDDANEVLPLSFIYQQQLLMQDSSQYSLATVCKDAFIFISAVVTRNRKPTIGSNCGTGLADVSNIFREKSRFTADAVLVDTVSSVSYTLCTLHCRL